MYMYIRFRSLFFCVQDVLPSGPATHFLSWAWGYSLMTVVLALRHWCQESWRVKRWVFLWLFWWLFLGKDGAELAKIWSFQMISPGNWDFFGCEKPGRSMRSDESRLDVDSALVRLWRFDPGETSGFSQWKVDSSTNSVWWFLFWMVDEYWQITNSVVEWLCWLIPILFANFCSSTLANTFQLKRTETECVCLFQSFSFSGLYRNKN